MNSIAKVFNNFKELYNEINGATLTGAIDVIAVEQTDGTYSCSPFHVRFGKLGVLRSREKIVDIEVNGEPVDIHMKLGESGEAFFVEECPEDDLEELSANLATSPLPNNEFASFEEERENQNNASEELQIPMPRRNSIDLSKECQEVEKKYENQISDYSVRRHTDNIVMERRDLSSTKLEFTTQKMRKEWAEHGEAMFTLELDEESKASPSPSIESKVVGSLSREVLKESDENVLADDTVVIDDASKKQEAKEESKSKKKRRKKSIMKKKNAQRKSSSSSSVGSAQSDQNDVEAETTSLNVATSVDESSPKTDEVLIKSTDKSTATPKTASTTSELNSKRLLDLDIHFFSDTEVTVSNPHGNSRPSTPIQSDSEIEISQREKLDSSMTNSALWKWGELPTQGDDAAQTVTEKKQAQRNSMLSSMFNFMKQSNKMKMNAADGVYLSDLDAEGMDPEMAALYFPQVSKNETTMKHEDDRESGNGTSLPHSPNSIEGSKSLDSDYEEGKISDGNFISLSLCGGMESGGPSDEEFSQHVVQHSEVCENPGLFSSPNLVVRLNGKYYSWAAACPIVMTICTFQKPLSHEAIEQLTASKKSLQIEPPISSSASNSDTKRGSSWWYWRRSNGKPSLSPEINDHSAVATQTSRPSTPDPTTEGKQDSKNDLSSSSDVSENTKSQNIPIQQQDSITKIPEKYRKTLRLSTEQIESLNLKPGMNEISFSVTTAYQGTTRCKCYLFRWKYNDKVVISDIDGTITKSDVLGHLLPMVGKDWAQIGVAPLFSKIEENGYKMLYLSARAIGQSRATREYLRSIRQGDVKLPDGPLLLNPTSLISAFHREVIEKKPEQFKIACLSDIKDLFPENPFYAGYGNRINDVWAYRAVGIPIVRIFTINTKGELKHELTQTFQSTYCNMAYFADQLYPPIQETTEDAEFTNFNYWRDPVPELDMDLPLTLTFGSTSTPTKALSSISEV